MWVKCAKCHHAYNDESCWTICPHMPLESSVKPFHPVNNPNGYCQQHDLFACPLHDLNPFYKRVCVYLVCLLGVPWQYTIARRAKWRRGRAIAYAFIGFPRRIARKSSVRDAFALLGLARIEAHRPEVTTFEDSLTECLNRQAAKKPNRKSKTGKS